MSSKSKSKSKSSSNNVSDTQVNKSTPQFNPDQSLKRLLTICAIIWQSLILYYIYNLEGADCKCESDWRSDKMHDTIKYLTMSLIGLTIITLFISSNNILNKLLLGADVVNLILFFIYINNQNKNKCICAVEKQYTLNYLLEIYTWIRIIAIVFLIIVAAYAYYLTYKYKLNISMD